jgi:hypothetical protein
VSDRILADIRTAYDKAIAKHGENVHDYPIWISLMTEELGEAAKEAHAFHWGGRNSVNRLLLLRGELIDLGQLVYATISQVDGELANEVRA